MKAQFAFLHGRFPAVVMEREDGEGVDVHVLAINEVREQVEDADDYQLVGSPFTLSQSDEPSDGGADVAVPAEPAVETTEAAPEPRAVTETTVAPAPAPPPAPEPTPAPAPAPGPTTL